MRRTTTFLVLLITVTSAGAFFACVGSDSGPSSTPDHGDASPGDPHSDATVDPPADSDVPSATCDPAKPFGLPVPIDELNATDSTRSARFDRTETTVVFDSTRNAESGDYDLFLSTRKTRDTAFATPKLLPEAPDAGIRTSGADRYESEPSLTGDGLKVAYVRKTVPNMVISERADLTQGFGAAHPLYDGGIGYARGAYLLPDFSAVYLMHQVGDAGNASYRIARLPRSSDAFDSTKIEEQDRLNFALPTDPGNGYPVVTADELRIYFMSYSMVAGAAAGPIRKVWTASRASAKDAWDKVAIVQELAGVAENLTPTFISSDQCRLYLSLDSPTKPAIIAVSTRPR